MTNSTLPKRAPAQKDATGIKMLIMVASLVATLGGWGILATGQVRAAVAAAQPPASLAQPAPQNVLRQVNAPVQIRPVARTRSSR